MQYRKFSFFISGLLATAFTLPAHATVGEVKQIDDNNLASFQSPPGTCQVKDQKAEYAMWLYIDYKDTATATRRLAMPFQGVGATCSDAELNALSQIAPWNLYLNDVENNNLAIGSHATCEQKYLVATLSDPIRLADQSMADTAVLEQASRAVACP
jgi:hypothetical protein